MGNYGYPPSHRDHTAPQPEVCDICGVAVAGHQLITANIDGIRGYRICDIHEPWRNAVTRRDVVRMNPGVPGPKMVGQGRIYEPGDSHWYLADPNIDDTNGTRLADDLGRIIHDDFGNVCLAGS